MAKAMLSHFAKKYYFIFYSISFVAKDVVRER